MKKKTIPEKLYDYFKQRTGAVTKDKICKDTGLKRSTVDRGCRILRKQGKIGMYWKRYWCVK